MAAARGDKFLEIPANVRRLLILEFGNAIKIIVEKRRDV